MNGIHIVDILIVIAYFAAMLFLGYCISRKSKSTEDYFVAGRSYKGWMLGLSMMSTTISSVTFLAFPAAAFASDWHLAVINFSWPVGMVIAA
ncbi:MAG: hypothetical protein J6S21_06680, partial [Victivallales bacterium]|nr:hypothetical protein [Victivallales bacterium]